MPEAIALTTPIAQPSIASYAPGSLSIALVPSATIVVTLIGTTGGVEVFQYPSPAGTAMDTAAATLAMIQTLNTANLSTRSLWRRVFDRLLLDFPSRFPGGATVT